MTYEFTIEQNLTLAQLAKRMKAVGIFLIIVGGLMALQGLVELVNGGNFYFSMILAAIYILMGVWTLKAAKAFNQVVHTEGHDVNHVMNALVSLLSLYSLQFWLFILFLVVMVLGLVLGGIGYTEDSSPLS